LAVSTLQMSTALTSLPNDAHSTAAPVQQQMGLDSNMVNDVINSLGDGAPLPSRDIPTATAAMRTDVEVQPNHITVDDDYISRLSTRNPAQNLEMVRDPEFHDLYLLPATAGAATLILSIPVVLAFLKKYFPKRFWESDGTPSFAFIVARAAAVGSAVFAADQYF